MRGAPQVGFSATIRKIRARTSLLTPFRPPTRPNLEIHVQYKRKPARCQFTTLRGVTKTRGFLHPDQNVLNATQNSLCRAVNRVRGCCACKASSCWRRAKFSRTRSSRERKELMIHPRRCRSDTIMARIVAEKSESSFSQFIHSAGVRRFGEAHQRCHRSNQSRTQLYDFSGFGAEVMVGQCGSQEHTHQRASEDEGKHDQA